MFSSMSRIPDLDLQVETIGNDLLKGALDLQKSINELQKLQYLRTMSQRMDMRKFGLDGGKSLAEFTQGSKRYAINNFGEEKLVRATSLRHSKDELKKVLRESIYMQNLLTASFDYEKGLSSRSLGFPSSSNRFNVPSELEGRKSSNSTATQPVKMRTPNLIARLMGLEDLPSEATQSVPKKQTLSVMIEKERTERLLKSDSFEGGKVVVDYSPVEVLKQEKAQQAKSVFYHIIVNETKKPPRPVDTKRDRSLNIRKGETLEMNEGKLIMDLEVMHCFDKECHDHSLDTNLKHEAATAVELVAEPDSVSNSQKNLKDVNRKSIRSLEKSRIDSFQQKQRSPPDHRKHKKDAIKPSKRAEERQKPGLNTSNSMKQIDVKATVTQMSQAKSLRMQLAKPEKSLVTAKNSVNAKSGSPPKLTTTSQVKSMVMNSSSPKIDRKTGNVQAKRSINNKLLKQDYTHLVYNSDKIDAARAISRRPDSKQSKKKKQWSKSSITDNIRKDHKVIDDIMPPSSRVRDPGVADATIVKLPKKEHTNGNTYEVEDLTYLLLSSKEIVALAQKLCSDTQQNVCDEKEDANRCRKSTKLHLSYGEELIARQGYCLELSNHPMWHGGSQGSLIYASLDELIEAIRKGINKLADYSKVDDDDDVISKDSLQVIWERDLQCNQMRLNAMWDLGWWNGICIEAADQIVEQVEELILSEFMEELVIDML